MDHYDEFHFNPNFEKQPEIESESSSEGEYESEEDGTDDERDIQAVELSSEVSGLASLIALNQTYLDLIERIEKKIECLLESNREEQKKIKQVLGNKKETNNSILPVYRTMFLPPYFKDIHNMIPTSNDETREIRSRCRLNILMKEEKSWSQEELNLLRRSVITQLTDVKNKEVIAKRDNIREKIINYKAEDKIEQLAKWKDELVAVNRRLNYLSSLDDETTLKSASYDEIDWARIAVRDFKGNRSILQIKMKWLFEQAPHWNKGPWTEAEDDMLRIAGKTPWQNWDLVTMKLDTKRSSFMCFERFHVLYKKISSKRPWTTREDEKLLSLIDRFTVEDSINWRKVAAHMYERTRIQCEIRYNRSLDPNLIHGRWTDDEDMLLIASVNKYGPHDWPRICRLVPGRTDVQCRARWVDNLDYKRSKAPWSGEEDEAVLVGIKVFGRSDYSSIAKMIPGRNTNSVKTRIRTLFRWKVIAERNNQSVTNSPLSQGMESYRTKSEETFERFNKVMEMSKKVEANQYAFALAHRLGYGNYIIEGENQASDYSLVKQKLKANFGQWFISKNGHWVRLKRNPNEFGQEELEKIVNDLPTEKKETLLKFFNERANRQIETDRTSNQLQQTQDPEQSARIAKLMEDVLIIEQKDIDAYRKMSQPSGFNFLKLPARNSVAKNKDKRPNQKLTASFSTLIHDLAPRRYSIADRLTDEITYRVDQLPTEERRNYILSLMCDMISNQMDVEVQNRLNTLPKPVLNVKILNYLHKALTQNLLEKDELVVIDDISNPELPTTSTYNQLNPTQFASVSDSELYHILQRLIIPSNANCNFLMHYKNIIGPMLLRRTKQLFPIMDKNLSSANPDEDGVFADIQLSEKVTADPSYKLLKQRIMRTFLLPMLLKRAFESNSVHKQRISIREAQNELKEVQKDRLAEANINIVGDLFIDENSKGMSASNNERIIGSLNSILPFPVFNPQVKTRLTVNDKCAHEVPTKRRRIQKISVPQPNERSVGQMLSSELKKETENILTNNEQILDSAQIYLTPNLYLPYRPRKTCFTPNQTPADMQNLSVRDFLLMNQPLPPTTQGSHRKSYKRRK